MDVQTENGIYLVTVDNQAPRFAPGIYIPNIYDPGGESLRLPVCYEKFGTRSDAYDAARRAIQEFFNEMTD
jgi:hypothetical protein